MSLGSLAFIPAPPFDTIGPFRLYGLMIALGVLASVALARWLSASHCRCAIAVALAALVLPSAPSAKVALVMRPKASRP